MVDLVQNSPSAHTPSFGTKWLSRADTRGLILILIALVLWCVLSQIASWLLPGNSENGMQALPTYLGYVARNGGGFLVLVGALALLKQARNSGEQSLFSHVKTGIQKHPKRAKTISVMLGLGMLTFPVFMYAYSTIKTRIPLLNAYQWDESFTALDRAIFFGRDPWTLFAWIYDVPALLRAMDFIYDIWAAILVGTWMLCFAAVKYPARIRFRFPLALMLTWFIGGNVMAVWLASAGPCYYGGITGLVDPFAAQMAELHAIHKTAPLRAVQYQNLLWSVYQSPGLGLGGISAMPSMHCATSFLLVCLAWNRKVLRYGAIAFATFIVISSVMLGWHYLVDGLFALPLTIGCWWLAGKILSRITQD